ncbi:siderophore-interacting protein [Salininema proteolyticum]|uniref:Siderophore-interacting protein n=1 Tax=Salininema proteolyticum TaxID=1607685 RepID=A0ABV8TUW3_9ACTN
MFNVSVVGLRRLSPSFLRVTFGGDALRDFADNGLDQRIKLIFPAPEGGYEGLVEGERWYQALRRLPEPKRPTVRTYTVRYARPEVAELDVDIVIHPPESHSGPALDWALNARIGDEIVVLGPNARYDGVHGGIDFKAPQGSEVLVGGDETALPAIAAICEGLPEDAVGRVVVEVPDSLDIGDLKAPTGVEITWIPRDGHPRGSSFVGTFCAAADELSIPQGDSQCAEIDIDSEILWELPDAEARQPGYVWLAAEAGVVKQVRTVLRKERGMDRNALALMGYWKDGRSL